MIRILLAAAFSLAALGVLPAQSFAMATETVGGIVFVHLPGGCFDMGSPADEPDRDDNERLHRVCVKPFALGKYEVSHAEFRRWRPSHYSTDNLSDGRQPANEITWFQATAYAEWLSLGTGRKIRLPTEAEWEYAARAGTRGPTHWGSSALRAGHSVCEECGTRWDARATAPVGSLPPNAFGLHDMLGNVWEWTCSAYDPDYRGAEQACSGDLSVTTRVRRGDGYADSARTNRSAYRSRAPLDYLNLPLGFRLLLELDDSPGNRRP